MTKYRLSFEIESEECGSYLLDKLDHHVEDGFGDEAIEGSTCVETITIKCCLKKVFGYGEFGGWHHCKLTDEHKGGCV